MANKNTCLHCIHYHHDQDYGKKYGYCDIGTKQGDQIHMRQTNTKACKKFKEVGDQDG